MKKPNTKFFISTVNTWPNRFNCEDMAEGNCFKYSDSEKNQFFVRETVYFSVYAAENFQATFKIKFGFEPHAFIELKREQSIIKIQNTDEIKGISRYMLNEQISFFKKKKKKKIINL